MKQTKTSITQLGETNIKTCSFMASVCREGWEKHSTLPATLEVGPRVVEKKQEPIYLYCFK